MHTSCPAPAADIVADVRDDSAASAPTPTLARAHLRRRPCSLGAASHSHSTEWMTELSQVLLESVTKLCQCCRHGEVPQSCSTRRDDGVTGLLSAISLSRNGVHVAVSDKGLVGWPRTVASLADALPSGVVKTRRVL